MFRTKENNTQKDVVDVVVVKKKEEEDEVMEKDYEKLSNDAAKFCAKNE